MPDDRSPAPTVGAPELVRVAHVRRVHGLGGEVRVQALGGDPGRFPPGTPLLGERERRRLTVASSRPLEGHDVLLAFEELRGREEAAVLSGDYLCVHASQARALGDDEWFVWQLLGLRAVTADGRDLGVVRDVEEHPSSDVLVVGHGSEEQRYPLVRQWISSIDLSSGVVVVTPWPEDEG